MDLRKTIEDLENRKEFKEWKKDNASSYLAHVFMMVKKGEELMEIGYYHEDGTITTFAPGESIAINHHKEIFQKEKKEVRKLDRSRIKLTLDKSLEIAGKLQKDKYPAEMPMSKMIVLQAMEAAHVYNITYLTCNFKTLNIKINAENGEIMQENLAPLIQFS